MTKTPPAPTRRHEDRTDATASAPSARPPAKTPPKGSTKGLAQGASKASDNGPAKDRPRDRPKEPPKDPRGTAARIRAAARALFLAKGYEGTSMDAVAAAAPVSKRTLYHHFTSKADLFQAVIDESWSHLTRAPLLPAEAAADPNEADPRAVLRSYVNRLAEHWDRPDVIPLLRLVIAEAPRFPELSQAYFAAGKEPAVKGLSAYFATLAEHGRLAAPLEPALAAAQFLGALKEPLFWPRVLGVPVAFCADATVERAIDALLGEAPAGTTQAGKDGAKKQGPA